MGSGKGDRIDVDRPEPLRDLASIAAHPLGYCEEERSAPDGRVEHARMSVDRPGPLLEQVEEFLDDVRGRVMNPQSPLIFKRLQRFPNKAGQPRSPLPGAHRAIANFESSSGNFDGNTIDEQFDINPPRGCDPLDDRGNHSGTITEAGSDAGLDEPEDLVVRSPRDPRQRDWPAARRSRTSRRSA